jgi:hypothetical protein
VTSFAKFRNDLQRLLAGAGTALVTTLIDYHGLPKDFPGMNSRPMSGTAAQRSEHVERAIHEYFGSPSNLLPFLSVHEFEAWLFSSPEVLPQVMTQPEKQSEFSAIRAAFSTPEEINERPGFAPSNRIQEVFPSYKKTLHGPLTVARIGIERIRAECPHFSGWLGRLEQFMTR